MPLQTTPDSYARIYAEISGVGSDEISAAGKVLRDIADHLSHTPQSASVGIALKKMVGAQDWEQYLKEIEKVLPKPKENGPSLPSWSDLIRDLLRQLETTHKGLTVSRKKEK